MIRIHNTDLEVFNGTGWQSLPSSYATVSMDQDIIDVIQWARKKRNEEQELKKLSEENVAIKDLLNQIDEKQQQIQMVATLIRKEETV
jgi:hypothetical protein